MVWGFGSSRICKPITNYFETLCTTFSPCKAICKPFSNTLTKETKNCKNCCAYCIKPSSVTKMERQFLKNKIYDNVHYLRPGAMCVVNIEENYLKNRRHRKKADKKICDKFAKQMGNKKKRRFMFKIRKGIKKT